MSQEKVSSTQSVQNELIRQAVENLRSSQSIGTLIEGQVEKLHLEELDYSPYFASFSEFIDLVLAYFYAELVTECIVGKLESSMASKTRSDFRKKLREILSKPFGESRSPSVIALNTITTLAFSRTSLMPFLIAEQLKLNHSISKNIRKAQARGWIRAEINPNQLSSFIITYSFGHILQDVSTMDNVQLNQENLINGIISHYFLTD